MKTETLRKITRIISVLVYMYAFFFLVLTLILGYATLSALGEVNDGFMEGIMGIMFTPIFLIIFLILSVITVSLIILARNLWNFRKVAAYIGGIVLLIFAFNSWKVFFSLLSGKYQINSSYLPLLLILVAVFFFIEVISSGFLLLNARNNRVFTGVRL